MKSPVEDNIPNWSLEISESGKEDKGKIPNPQLDKISQIGDLKIPNWGYHTKLGIFICWSPITSRNYILGFAKVKIIKNPWVIQTDNLNGTR